MREIWGEGLARWQGPWAAKWPADPGLSVPWGLYKCTILGPTQLPEPECVFNKLPWVGVHRSTITHEKRPLP